MLLPMADGIAIFFCNRWLMLLPGGWCFYHHRVWFVVCCRQMELPRVYFNFSSEVLNGTSSHMCGRWNLPTFLFRDGLLTLINKASLIALFRFWSSLPTMLKLSILMSWPEMVVWSKMGEGPFWCSLNLSPNTLEDSPMLTKESGL